MKAPNHNHLMPNDSLAPKNLSERITHNTEAAEIKVPFLKELVAKNKSMDVRLSLFENLQIEIQSEREQQQARNKELDAQLARMSDVTHDDFLANTNAFIQSLKK